jgi:hypothetical protein
MSKQTDLINIPDAITVDGSNVGIGTSSSYPLTVQSGTAGSNHALALRNSSNNFSRLGFLQTDSATAAYTSIDGDGRADGYLKFNTNDTERMKIDSSGRVTKPNQPSFWMTRSGDQTGYNPNNYSHSVIFNYEQFDIGNNVSTTTGLFTAPVDGVYIFFASAYSHTNTFGQAWFTLNGGRGASSDFVKSSADNFINCSVTFKLSANDTVGYHPHGSGTNSTIRANVNHTWFRGHLLG